MNSSPLRVAVVGHIEWVQFARVERMPRGGEVVHAYDAFEEPAGGGAVTAVQLARLAGECVLFTALGEDDEGRRSVKRLSELGVEVRASFTSASTRRAVSLVDDAGERMITTFGPRLEPLEEEDPATRAALADRDAIYFTAGGERALRTARDNARVLVASPRARDAIGHGVGIDALVLSGDDEMECREAARVEGEAKLVVWTEGARGGHYRDQTGPGGWDSAMLSSEPVDSYGCGDSFAAGLTYALGAGLDVPHALALAARCGAECLTGRGPYEHQLTAADL
jgi:ribokinase